MGQALFIAEGFGGWDGDGVAGGQQAGEDGVQKAFRRHLQTYVIDNYTKISI